MTSHGAARQYADALFDVAQRNGTVERVQRDLGDFAALVASNDDLRRVLTTPTLPMSEKGAIVRALVAAAGDVSKEVARLLDLLADRDRLGLSGDIVRAFGERVLAANHVVEAEVTTAVPLDEAARTKIHGALSRAVGLQVTMTERVDPSIVGGVVARVGSLVFDGSVTRQLERLRETMLAEA